MPTMVVAALGALTLTVHRWPIGLRAVMTCASPGRLRGDTGAGGPG